jgi:hypothetical protein
LFNPYQLPTHAALVAAPHRCLTNAWCSRMACVCGTKCVVRNRGTFAPAYCLIAQKPSPSLAAGCAKRLTKFTCTSVNVCSIHFPVVLVRGPVHYQFGMFPPKRLGNVAAPADGPMRLQRFLQLFGRNLVPLNGLALVIDQGRGMIVPVDFSETFVAIHALLSLIPPVNDRPNQAGLRRFLDLCQTLLPAGFPFRPTRAFTQPEALVPNSCFQSLLPCGNSYGCRPVRLRT